MPPTFIKRPLRRIKEGQEVKFIPKGSRSELAYWKRGPLTPNGIKMTYGPHVRWCSENTLVLLNIEEDPNL